MNDIRRMSGKSGISLPWMARLLSLGMDSVFLLFLILAVTNEDKPQGPAISVLVLLVLTIGASLAAWRWEKAGGALVVAGGLCLGVAAYRASLASGLGSTSYLPAFIYGAPFIVVGILFWISGTEAAGGPKE